MLKKSEAMDRRRFLFRFFTIFSGTFLGLNSLYKVYASENRVQKSKIAIIIDDIGFSLHRLQCFLKIGVPLTFAVLPKLDQTCYLTEEIHGHDHEVILHQPMEPFDPNIDPGPGAIYVGDTPSRIIRTVEENISEVPYVSGVNNHMGSKFTACYEDMIEVLGVVRDKDLFFIDSLTTNHSMGYRAAKSLNIASAHRNLFLDNLPEKTAILSQLYKLRMHALRFGYAIGIGHPFEETAMAIDTFQKVISNSKISFVHISGLIL